MALYHLPRFSAARSVIDDYNLVRGPVLRRQGRQTLVKVLRPVPRADHKGYVQTRRRLRSRLRGRGLARMLDRSPIQGCIAATEGVELGDRAVVPPNDQEIRGSESFPSLGATFVDIEMNDADGRRNVRERSP